MEKREYQKTLNQPNWHYWTLEKITEAAKKCESREQYYRSGLYAAAKYKKVHDLCSAEIPYKKKRWTFDAAMEIAKKYTNTEEFHSCEPALYNTARRRGWLTALRAHMIQLKTMHTFKWTYESALENAKTFNNTTEWKLAKGSSWNWAQKRRLLKKIGMKAGWVSKIRNRKTNL